MFYGETLISASLKNTFRKKTSIKNILCRNIIKDTLRVHLIVFLLEVFLVEVYDTYKVFLQETLQVIF